MKRKAIVAAAMIALVAALTISVPGQAKRANIHMAGASLPLPTPAELAQLGVTLSDPQTATPSAAAANAAGQAAAASTNATVMSESYMHVVATNGPNALDRDLWVVVMDPSSYHYPGVGGAAPTKWSLILVDPSTDAVIEGLNSST